MTLLIPDARRGLLGGLIDDAALLGTPAPPVEDAVERYRMLRTADFGWTIGRFLIPASRLEDLAGVLVRTMTRGETPWSIGAVLGDDPAGNASAAAAFHAAMDPAARIDVVRLPKPPDHSDQRVIRSLAAGRGIQPDALPMLATYPDDESGDYVDAIVRTRPTTVQPAGVHVDVERPHEPAALAGIILRCIRADIPLTIGATSPAAVTATDPATAKTRYGALNLLAAASEHADQSVARVTATLIDGNPAAFDLSFAGIVRRSAAFGPVPVSPASRGPLMSIASTNPEATIRSITEVVTIE
jgi:hypothetical protein